jgi:hypothetical protein
LSTAPDHTYLEEKMWSSHYTKEAFKFILQKVQSVNPHISECPLRPITLARIESFFSDNNILE